MKKLINDPEAVVVEMLEGMEAAFPNHLRQLPEFQVMVRADSPVKGKVALVSGGGSGHEPCHAGWVGHGMLDAAVAGNAFTSPTPDQVFEAIKAIDGGEGVFMVVKNYTGDVMNFEMAGEMAEAEGIKTAHVVVNDDVAVQDSLYTAGRRGVCGTVLTHKIAGARAQAGGNLEQVQAVAEKVVRNVRTMGMALTPCTVPAAGKPTFTLAENEMEVGIGIHGEPGTHREELKPADEIVDHLLGKVIDDLPFQSGDEVVLVINGMGGTPLMELFIANRRASQVLQEKNISVYRTMVGNYMTALEMAGFSITLLKLDDELKELLEAPVDTPSWVQF